MSVSIVNDANGQCFRYATTTDVIKLRLAGITATSYDLSKFLLGKSATVVLNADTKLDRVGSGDHAPLESILTINTPGTYHARKLSVEDTSAFCTNLMLPLTAMKVTREG